MIQLMNHFVVVSDPRAAENPIPEGEVVVGEMAQGLEVDGVLLLPVDVRQLPQRGAVGAVASTAYQRHAYGRGVRFDGGALQRGCPVAVCLPTSLALVEWWALVVGAQGSLRMASDESPGGHVSIAGSTSSDVRHGLVRGRAAVRGIPGAYATLCLAGACDGVRVMWLALTVLPG